MTRVLFAAFAAVLITSSLAADEVPIATILAYHEVEPGGMPPHSTRTRKGADPNALEEQIRFTVALDDFQRQLDYLEANDYHVIPLADLVDYLSGKLKTLPPRAVVITVDDGWLCTYTQIFPALQKRKMPFTALIYPYIIDEHGHHYVTWKQVEEMAKAGVDIESHTYTHPFLTLTNNGSVRREAYVDFLKHELLDSRKAIEKHTGKPVRFLAFPYGDYDQAVIDAAVKYGYEAAMYDREQNAVVSPTTPPMRLRRAPMRHNTTMERFKSYLQR